MAQYNGKSDIRKETKDFLRSTDTVSRPLALVFVIAIILVVSAVVFSLFLGGRWLYQHLDGSNQPKTTVVENPITAIPPTASTSTGDQSSTPSTSSASATSNSAASTQTTSTTTPTTGPSASTGTIPATGPNDVLALFAITTVLSLIAHNAWLRLRKIN